MIIKRFFKKLENHNLLHDPYEEIVNLYYERLMEKIPKKLISTNEKCDLKFVYTAMHGVGYPFIEKSFEMAKLQPVVAVLKQRDPDPDFPTVDYPNPEEDSCLKMSIDLAEAEKITIILANDPDADRLSCAEKNPMFVYSHILSV